MSRAWTPPANATRDAMGHDKYDGLARSSKKAGSTNARAVQRKEKPWRRLHSESKLQAARPRQLVDKGEPLTTPIYHTSIYKNTSIRQYMDIVSKSGYIYQRLGNPTVEAAELAINQLEKGAGTLLYNSGLAAVNALFLCFLKAGDHIVCQKPCYSGTYHFVTGTMTKFGINVSWAEAGAPMDTWAQLIRADTKMIYAETPCNPNIRLCDLYALAELGRKMNVRTAVDVTFASPVVQAPIEYGIDFSIHSCSKYLGGHSDLIGGCVTTRSLDDWKELKFQMNNTGLAMAPFEAALLHRGVKTVALRVERQSQSALAVAEFLQSAKDEYNIQAVHYPGLKSHKDYELAKRQNKSGLFGGMLAFEMQDDEHAKRVVEGVQLVNLCVSLGGTESLIEHPASMTHGPLFTSSDSTSADSTHPGLIRMSVGLEHVDDIICDLRQALKEANAFPNKKN